MSNDPQIIIGLMFLAVLLLTITLFWAREIFQGEPYFQMGLIIGEISFIILAIMNPWLLRVISFVFAFVIIAVTFLSSVILSWQTIVLGVPSMVFFCYSLLFGKGEFLIMAVTSLIFFVGLVLSLRETKHSVKLLGRLFPAFAFSLAIVGVFLIPAIFPQMGLFNGIAEIMGTTGGLVAYWYSKSRG